MAARWRVPRHLAAGPCAAGLAALALLTLLLATIALTLREYGWMDFLFGILAAAVVASISRSTNAAWVIARRTAQLASVRNRLAEEVRRRERAEKSVARASANVAFVDDALPAMLNYIDRNGCVRYHNHAYARWLGLGGDAIDGRPVRDLLGAETYAQIEARLNEALAGHEVRFERTQVMADGQSYRLFAHYLPQFDASGTVAGIFAILTDITGPTDLPADEPARAGDAPSEAAGKRESDPERLLRALDEDAFSLYLQAIAPLVGNGSRPFYEVQLRQREEEEKHTPPGTFLAIAQEQGLMRGVDAWVVRHVLDCVPRVAAADLPVYIVGVSVDTLRDPSFADLVSGALAARDLPGSVLCFESPECDVVAFPAAYAQFSHALGSLGCQLAVSGYGLRAGSLALLDKLDVQYLKLDGGIVLDMLRSRAGLAKVKAINEAAHSAGMRTVAECVENERTRVALQRLDTDYAQGIGISKPRRAVQKPAGAAAPSAPAALGLAPANARLMFGKH